MRRSWTPSIVPSGHDQTFYIVINNYGKLGPAFAETDLGEADLETTISDLMSGQYSDRIRVVARSFGVAGDMVLAASLSRAGRSRASPFQFIVFGRRRGPAVSCWRSNTYPWLSTIFRSA